LLGINGNVVSGFNEAIVTVHGLFQVTEGSNTFYFLGEEQLGDFEVWDQQLTIVFLPTAYGTVEPTIAGGPAASKDRRERPRDADRDVVGDRGTASADDIARLQRELDDLRAEVRELRKQSRQSRQNSQD
jgi:hypothetical protein